MDKCTISGRLGVELTGSEIRLTVKGDFAEELRRKKESDKLSRLDVLESFDGKEVDVELQCSDPNLPEKTRKALQVIN